MVDSAALSAGLPRVPKGKAPASALLLTILLGLFLLSGVSGLIYQVLWLRMLSLTFGVTIYAASTVLTSFMGGLALGSFLAGRVADRWRAPLLAYGIIEILIGLLGLLTPHAFDLMQTVYTGLYPSLPGDSLLFASLIRFGLATLILIVPTILMGATLPIIVKSSLARSESISRNITLLYAANTFGAIVGVVSAGYFLIGFVGVSGSIAVAAMLNLGAGLGAIALHHLALAPRSGPSKDGPDRPFHALGAADDPPKGGSQDEGWRRGAPAPHSAPVARLVLIVFGLSGGVSLAYEVVWFRILVQFSNSSTYAFTIMLAMVLLGIALGSYAVAPLIQRSLNWLLVFAALELAVGGLSLLSITIFSHLYDLVGLLATTPPAEVAMADPDRFMALASGLTIFPPMFLLGMTFPVAAKIYAPSPTDVGRRVGSLYAANVFGAIFGAFAAGFILIPALGTQSSLFTLGTANLALGLLLWYACPNLRRWWKPGLAVILAVAWSALWRLSPDLQRSIATARFPTEQLVWHHEGLENTISVTRQSPWGRLAMYLNGYLQASDDDYLLRLHRWIGHLPLVVHPRPQEVLIIGLGGGATAGAISQHPGVSLDVVELSEGVIRAAQLFASINYEVLRYPGLRLRIDDGRNHLLLTPRRYDVIAADIIPPNHAGSTNLYSVDYYHLVKNALKEDGLMAQWLPPIPEYRYKMMLRTFLTAFPQVTLWAFGSDFLLIGSRKPLQLDGAALREKFSSPQTSRAPSEVGLGSGDVGRFFVAGDAELRRYVGDGPIISDNHPYIEYNRFLPAGRAAPRPSDWQGAGGRG